MNEQRTVFLDRALEPIRPWLLDETVVEICANRPGEVWIEIAGGTEMQRHEVPTLTAAALRYLMERVAAFSRQSVNEEHPLLSAALPGGERFQGVLAPATPSGGAFTIRKQVVSAGYELVVAARWNPALPGEGRNRWALLQLQNSRRNLAALLVPWTHFLDRLNYPATRPETVIRALIAAGGTLCLGVGLLVASIAMRKPKHHGDARFGNVMDAERKSLVAKNGLLLGRLNGVTLRSDDPSHVLVVGPTRSGKGVSFVIPNGYMWRGSSVWFDPKREVFEAIGAPRQALGDKVFMFSPGERDTHRFNPLDYIRRDARMATDAAIVASFIIPEGTGSSEIWARTGRQLLAALIGYVVASPRYEGQRHLRPVSELTSTGVEFLRVLVGIRDDESEFLPAWVVQGLNQFISLEKETRNSAFFNVTAALNPWSNDLVAAATSTTDFDIAQLRREPMAIFIGCSVAQLDVFRPIIKILVQQIHDVLMASMPGPDEPLGVLLMIDEFRQLGRMDSIVSKLTINAGYGFRMVLILQDLAQLDEVYGKATRETTLSACQVKLFIRINDLTTSEYVSEMLGSTTIEVRTPIIRGGQGIFAARDKSVSYQERALRTPEELRHMPANRAIVLVPNAPGFEIRKIAYFEDRPYKAIYKGLRGRKLVVPPLPAWERRALRTLKDIRAQLEAQTTPAPVGVLLDLLEPDMPATPPGSTGGGSEERSADAEPPLAWQALSGAAPIDESEPPEPIQAEQKVEQPTPATPLPRVGKRDLPQGTESRMREFGFQARPDNPMLGVRFSEIMAWCDEHVEAASNSYVAPGSPEAEREEVQSVIAMVQGHGDAKPPEASDLLT